MLGAGRDRRDGDDDGGRWLSSVHRVGCYGGELAGGWHCMFCTAYIKEAEMGRTCGTHGT